MLTKEEFESLTPHQRGYAVYMAGSRKDQPNIPDEKCPYEGGSLMAEEWHAGQWSAMLECQDGEE